MTADLTISCWLWYKRNCTDCSYHIHQSNLTNNGIHTAPAIQKDTSKLARSLWSHFFIIWYICKSEVRKRV